MYHEISLIITVTFLLFLKCKIHFTLILFTYLTSCKNTLTLNGENKDLIIYIYMYKLDRKYNTHENVWVVALWLEFLIVLIIFQIL